MKLRRSLRLPVVFVVLLSLTLLHSVLPATALTLDPFQETWSKTDRLVRDGTINRTWMWGPQENAYATREPYVNSPNAMRNVVYFDKSRMEITDPSADRSSGWYVTNGLLVVELVTGRLQVGDNAFEQREPAPVNVAGDADDPDGPTYASFTDLRAPVADTQPGILALTVDRQGNVGHDDRFASYGVEAAWYAPETSHWVAAPFWEFMTSSGPIWTHDGVISEQLFENPFYATGLPITEAYWATVRVAGESTDVLIQCFERRCLTYTPDNPPGWQVEAGNVGQHYFMWRYGKLPPKPLG